MPFEKAVNQARKLLNANVFQNPRYSVKHGKRVKLMKILLKLLGENQLLESQYYLQQMASHKKSDVKTAIMI
jgi:Na+-transporting NADH:ubiquinone oxidoreductase subunit NqrA